MKIEALPIRGQLAYESAHILEGGHAFLSPEWGIDVQSSPYSRLYYFLEGEAWLEESGGSRLAMRAGHFYLVPAGLSFSAGCVQSAEKYYFHLNLLKRDGYDWAMELDHVVSFPLDAAHLEQLKELISDQSFCGVMRLRMLLTNDMLCALEKQNIGAFPSVYSPPVQQAVEYIHRHLSVHLSVHRLAERLYLSERTLNQLFKEEIGKTVSQYIGEMIIFEAQRRLLLTDISLAEISDALGFCDQFYFSRRFKECCGKTPSRYRKEGRM